MVANPMAAGAGAGAGGTSPKPLVESSSVVGSQNDSDNTPKDRRGSNLSPDMSHLSDSDRMLADMIAPSGMSVSDRPSAMSVDNAKHNFTRGGAAPMPADQRRQSESGSGSGARGSVTGGTGMIAVEMADLNSTTPLPSAAPVVDLAPPQPVQTDAPTASFELPPPPAETGAGQSDGPNTTTALPVPELAVLSAVPPPFTPSAAAGEAPLLPIAPIDPANATSAVAPPPFVPSTDAITPTPTTSATPL